jgi:hypothetical protein
MQPEIEQSERRIANFVRVEFHSLSHGGHVGSSLECGGRPELIFAVATLGGHVEDCIEDSDQWR